MSEVTDKFLHQLRGDMQLLADDSCPISRRLTDMAGRLEFVEQGRATVILWDKERGRFSIDASHPAVKTLINNPARRRSDVVFFISSLATLLNREEPEITDEDERAFHAKLLRFAADHATGSWSA